MERTALFSKDQRYRYRLSRIWDREKPLVLFIMHNPSTADAYKEDPTLRRIINFAKDWGFGGLYVGNLYPYCAVRPEKDRKLPNTVINKNKRHLKMMINRVDKVLFAWGNKQLPPAWLIKKIETPYCIACSDHNIPKHPLFLKKNYHPKQYFTN